MIPGVAIERVETLDPTALARCDFVYPFDSAFARPRAGRMLAVLRVDGRVAGYLACQRDGDAGEVRRLEIDRGHRGQGLGRRLLDEARRWAAELGLSALVLETLADNPAAGRFFGRNGFVQRDAANALHWQLPLDG
ncbi:GNAT family N-acetyltransferase [Sphingomonas sp. KR3-1]|uniref:GNAT family N-acetyltransferase n=1 Tax=Sphingomonas sp. KR3-1 TaxID=3156611 RepID=UPI0032B39085